ncbi:MAG: ATP-binding cassette domain-containing protein, partial [bacterium]
YGNLILMIEIKDIWKGFRKNEVLKGVSLNIEEGKTYVILGRSGCGKSVLLKIIIGLMKPDKGRVIIFKRDITSLSEDELMKTRQMFSVVFQESALFDFLNVFENVGFFLIEHTNLNKSDIMARVKHSLSLVGLSNIENLYPVSLSGGMKKRVALARAIITNPKIILYDEPTTGIDPITGSEISHLIKDLSNRLNVTSIVVTHDIALSYDISDKIAMLCDGKIIIEGTQDEIKQSNNPHLRQFITGGREFRIL